MPMRVKFEFINIEWNGTIADEISSLLNDGISYPHRLLSIACRQIAVNAEDNHRYEEASNFRYMSMDARRREKWRGFAILNLYWWYWAASGYGERIVRAFLILVGLWLLF